MVNKPACSGLGVSRIIGSPFAGSMPRLMLVRRALGELVFDGFDLLSPSVKAFVVDHIELILNARVCVGTFDSVRH
jgi:hypothetical protein